VSLTSAATSGTGEPGRRLLKSTHHAPDCSSAFYAVRKTSILVTTPFTFLKRHQPTHVPRFSTP